MIILIIFMKIKSSIENWLMYLILKIQKYN